MASNCEVKGDLVLGIKPCETLLASFNICFGTCKLNLEETKQVVIRYCEFPKITTKCNVKLFIDSFSHAFVSEKIYGFNEITILPHPDLDLLCKAFRNYNMSKVKDLLFRALSFELNRQKKPYRFLTTVGKKGQSLLRIIHCLKEPALSKLCCYFFPPSDNDNFNPIHIAHFINKYPNVNGIERACEWVNRVRNQFCFATHHPNCNWMSMKKVHILQNIPIHGTNKQFAEKLMKYIEAEEEVAELIHLANGNCYYVCWNELLLDPWLGRVFPVSEKEHKLKASWSFIIKNDGVQRIWNVIESFQPNFHVLVYQMSCNRDNSIS